MTTATFELEGLTCGSCLAEVLENVHVLSGVTGVSVDLVAGGRSPMIVTSGARLGVQKVRDAVENAGFDLTVAQRRELRRRVGSPLTQDGDTRAARDRNVSTIGDVSS